MSEAPNGDPEPGAAESWTVSEDGKTYVFALRRNARWSNGDPVTAHDFVYGFRRAADPKTLSTYTFILSPIENADEIAAGQLPPEQIGVRALDDYSLEIELANATPYFLGLLAHSMTYPVHRASVEKYGDEVHAARTSRRQWRIPARRVGRAIAHQARAQSVLLGRRAHHAAGDLLLSDRERARGAAALSRERSRLHVRRPNRAAPLDQAAHSRTSYSSRRISAATTTGSIRRSRRSRTTRSCGAR